MGGFVCVPGQKEAQIGPSLGGPGEEVERKDDTFFRLDASAEAPSAPAPGGHGGEGE